jgi:hypothetical protein
MLAVVGLLVSLPLAWVSLDAAFLVVPVRGVMLLPVMEQSDARASPFLLDPRPLQPVVSTHPERVTGADADHIPTSALSLFQERKYFDSGDYAMHKAGVSSDLGGRPLAVGTAIPTPEG